MLVNEIINNPDLDLDAHFIIRCINWETGEEEILYRSWEGEKVPSSIRSMVCNYITIREFEERTCIMIEVPIA